MTWQIKWDDRARKELRKLDASIQNIILKYLRERVLLNPRNLGKELVADMKGLWRYRVQDFRIICRLQEAELIILVVKVAHRKEIY